jgi:hypothetical protein
MPGHALLCITSLVFVLPDLFTAILFHVTSDPEHSKVRWAALSEPLGAKSRLEKAPMAIHAKKPGRASSVTISDITGLLEGPLSLLAASPGSRKEK